MEVVTSTDIDRRWLVLDFTHFPDFSIALREIAHIKVQRPTHRSCSLNFSGAVWYQLLAVQTYIL